MYGIGPLAGEQKFVGVACVVACVEGRDGGVSMERTHVRNLGRLQGSAWWIMGRVHLFYLRLCHGN